jgi:hypothetical protein
MEKKDKTLLDYEHKLIIERINLDFDLKMKTLEYIRITDKIRHEQELERQRIKSAEIRKNYQRKEALQYGQN